MDDAMSIAGMLVATGRAVRPNRWVTELIEAEQESRWNAIA